jgi:hypothetical protein
MRTYLIAVLALVVALPALAQKADLGQSLPDASDDGFILLVPARDEDTILFDLQLSQESEKQALGRIEGATHLINVTATRINQQKAEIERIKGDKKVAEAEKNEADKQRHEERKKDAERKLQLLEANRELRKAELAVAQVQLDFNRKRIVMFNDELKLHELRAQQNRIVDSKDPGSLARLGSLSTQIRTLEETLLQQFEKVLDLEQDYVGKRREAVKERRRIFDHQQKIMGVK